LGGLPSKACSGKDVRCSIDGFDTDLAGLDIRYICHDYGIRVPPWAVPLIGD